MFNFKLLYNHEINKEKKMIEVKFKKTVTRKTYAIEVDGDNVFFHIEWDEMGVILDIDKGDALEHVAESDVEYWRIMGHIIDKAREDSPVGCVDI